MKVPERIRVTHLLLAGLPLLFLAGWSGQAAGRARAASASLSGETNAGMIAEQADPSRAPAEGKGDASRGPLNVKKKLDQMLRVWRESPNPDLDFELSAEFNRLLSGLTSDEFRALYRESVSRLPFRQQYALLTAWAVMDPTAAIDSLDGGGRDKFLVIGLYREWMLRDPDAAMKWLSEGDASPALKERARILRLNAMRDLVEVDADSALAQIPKMERAEAVQNLKEWLFSDALSEAMRQRVLETATSLATPEELVGIQKAQAVKMAEKDPAAAMALASMLELPESERLQFDASLHFAREDVPLAKALDEWMAAHGDDTEVPREVQVKISTLMSHESEEADRWLSSLPAGPQRDLIYEKAVRSYLGLGRPQQAVGLLEGIESPSSRAVALRALDRLWPQVDGKAASAWREGLAEEDRELLEE